MRSTLYYQYLFILLFFSLIFFTKCANRVPPTGGPRDTIPPSLVYSNPKHQAINTHTRVFEFTFDERIQIKNLQKQLIITPRIDFDYEVKQGKKGFFLIFENDFQDSITYTFNFRDAIQDLTEGNPTKDNKFTFSTGPTIDSLSIEGYAIDLLTKDSIKEATIGLYVVEDTTTIYNGSPYYFAETDDKGHYKLDNIKNGTYRLYGFKDGNSNLELDAKNESYAFKIDTIVLTNHLENENLFFTNLDYRDLKKLTALPSGKNFDINYNKTLIEFQVIPLNRKVKLYSHLVKENKSIRIYNTFTNQDSTAIQVTAIDSIRNQKLDTVWVKFNESQRKPEEFALTLTPSDKSSIQNDYVAEIKISKPLLKLNADSIYFRFDTIPISYIQQKEQVLTNKHNTEFKILFSLNRPAIDSIKHIKDSIRALEQQIVIDSLQEVQNKTPDNKEVLMGNKKTISQEATRQNPGKGLNLYLGKGAFISAENDTTTTTTFSYQFIDPIEYGNIKGKAITNSKLFIIQLLDNSNTIVKEVYTKDLFEFKHVKPGDYKLRIFIDENDNGRWDYGNILRNIPPEPVFFYKTPEETFTFTVRANWLMTDIVIQH